MEKGNELFGRTTPPSEKLRWKLGSKRPSASKRAVNPTSQPTPDDNLAISSDSDAAGNAVCSRFRVETFVQTPTSMWFAIRSCNGLAILTHPTSECRFRVGRWSDYGTKRSRHFCYYRNARP